MKNFKDKLAVVTGASSGIGEAIALRLAKAGARLVLVARDRERLEAVRAACAAAGATVHVEVCDVADLAQVRQMAENVHARYDSIDLLINNAGVVMMGLVLEVEPADWQRLWDNNVMGVIHGCQAFVPKMIEAGRGGHVVNTASIAGLIGIKGLGTYSASKFAVVGLSQSLRAELRPHRIGVTAVCPGTVKTPIQQGMKMVGSLTDAKTRKKVDAYFRMSRLVADDVARRTLSAIKANERQVTIGIDAKLGALTGLLAPAILERI